MAYVRTVRTASGARAVKIVHSTRRGSRDIEHIGSAHDDAELELLQAVARQRLAAGQGELDLGLQPPPAAGGPLPITSSRMGHLWDALTQVGSCPDLPRSPPARRQGRHATGSQDLLLAQTFAEAPGTVRSPTGPEGWASLAARRFTPQAVGLPTARTPMRLPHTAHWREQSD